MPSPTFGLSSWPLERRLKIADDLADIPRKFDLPIALGWVEREKVSKALELPENFTMAQKTLSAHVAAFLDCAMMTEQWMRKETKDEVCMLIVEDNDQARKTIRAVHNHHQSKNIVAALDGDALIHFPLRKIKEDPLFQPKKPSHPLIVADFCAYVWKQFLVENTKYDQFFEPMRGKIIYLGKDYLQRQREKHARNSRQSLRRQVSGRSL